MDLDRRFLNIHNRNLIIVTTCLIILIISSLFLYSKTTLNTTITTPLFQTVIALQTNGSSNNSNVESLFIALLANGSAIVEYDLKLPKSQLQHTNIILEEKNIIQDLEVSDYFNNPLEYRFDERTGKLSINSSGLDNLYIHYSTSDLTDKKDRVWTFAFDSPLNFSLKMPQNAQIIKWGEPPSFVRKTAQQNLLMFGPGNIQVSYIIGSLGTNEEANAVINVAKLIIQNAKDKYPNINLAESENLLKQAQNSKLNKKYLEASTYGINANERTIRIIEDYELAQNTIYDAESKLEKTMTDDGNNSNTGFSRSGSLFLDKARDQFQSGDYNKAKLYAEAAMMKNTPELSSFINSDSDLLNLSTTNNNNPFLFMTFVFAIIITISAAVIILFIFIKMRFIKISKNILSNFMNRSHNNKNDDNDYQIQKEKKSSYDFTSSSSLTSFSSADNNNNYSNAKPLFGSSAISNKNNNNSFPLPQRGNEILDRNFLKRIVMQILSENQNLRPEDKLLLDLLVEKKGSAFEKDIRNTLLLPKTSVWRLIRRLEREEIIEIVKVDCQNLIKLRFDRYNRE